MTTLLGLLPARVLMKARWGIVPLPILLAAALSAAAPVGQEKAGTAQPRPNQCLQCHSNADVWEGERLRLYVTETNLAGDIHWQKGLRCADCHGGNPTTEEVNEAHARKTVSAASGRCRKTTPSRPSRSKSWSSAATATPTSNTCGATGLLPAPINWPNTGPAVTARR